GEAELGRLLAREVPEDERRDHEGEQPELDLGRPELRVLRGDDDVAAEREAESASERVAVEARDERLRRALHGLEERDVRRAPLVPREEAVALHRGEVAAGTERLLARARDDDRADLVVRAGELDASLQALERRLVERVPLGL